MVEDNTQLYSLDPDATFKYSNDARLLDIYRLVLPHLNQLEVSILPLNFWSLRFCASGCWVNLVEAMKLGSTADLQTFPNILLGVAEVLLD